MEQPPQSAGLAKDIRSRLNAMPALNTVAIRAMRREFSPQLVSLEPQNVIELALQLLDDESGVLRFVAYELVCHHKLAFAQLTTDDLLKLGKGLDSWSSVDCFGMYLSGPMWARGGVSDKTIATWARSEDRWWRRAALVSTIALSRRGSADDLVKVTRMCTLFVQDRDDMVLKALSWALRELAKKHPEQVRRFLAEHRRALAARVIREVNNKLRTGLKTPRSRE